ncbi:hypothetical protein OOT46_17870 [Aquabacterium sp. A7-Y]|uniref:immunoglobulin domain-containing protein n=1 Tax=Aquabacterium sp. A7-Y TaxID=1349605 RepID=UPI00223C941D|nr:immunoglobulin domain-containing protein [Aquabacterium sp. A7-Y]MCW7539709.1 hypothetical protein [Aquabacterium sp. A7-Y]
MHSRSSGWRFSRQLLRAFFVSSFLLAGLAGSPRADTLFGSSIHREPSNETWPNALARHDALFGPLKVVRIFFPGAPEPWTHGALNHDRAVVVSFKLPPREVLSGVHDAQMRTWFAAAPRDRKVWWVYWHEPEDDIRDGRFTAQDYRAAFQRLDSLADAAGNPMLRTTQVLMDWTLDRRSGRNWRDYYPGAQVIDVQAWDQYNYTDAGSCAYTSMEDHEANRPAHQITQAEGNEYAIAEIGSQECLQGRPDWLRALGRWARDRAVFVTYFHATVGGDFRLNDAASQEAWRSVTTGSLFWGAPVLGAQPAGSIARTSATLHCDVDPRELSTQFWFVSWRPHPGGALEWQAHPKVTLSGGLKHRTLSLTGLTPNARYRYTCKAQNSAAAQPVSSDMVDFQTLP